MKALSSIALGLLCAFSTTTHAASPLRPVFPVIPVVPVLPRPVLDSVDVGVAPFVGYGFRTEFVEFRSRHVKHMRLRLPSHCAIQINPIVARGENGRAHGQLVTTYNDGAYTHFIYSVNGSRGAELNEIELGLSSPFVYNEAHGCGVRVFVSGNY
jgi:hypothetical protein